MSKKQRYKHVTIHPSQGGALIGSTSDDIPLTDERNYLSSSANYTEKLNFRREVDGELRREGWDLFNPSGNDDAINSEEPIRGLHQFTGTDGTPVLIAVAGNKVLKLQSGDQRFAIDYQVDFDNPNPITEYATIDGLDAPENISYDPEYFTNNAEDFTWETIYTFPNYMDAKEADGTYKDPFEGGAYRWEFAEIRNHLVINNGVDLPVVYKGEYTQAYPLYGLRENGVMSVGTISNFQDRLFCGDLTMISTGFETWFEEASDPYGNLQGDPLFGTVQTQRHQYRIVYSAEGDPKLFNAGIEENGAVIAESGGLPGNLTINASGEYLFQYSQQFAVNTEASMYQEFKFGIHGDVDHVGAFLDETGTIKFDNENFSAASRTSAINALKARFAPRETFTDSEILEMQISLIPIRLQSGIFFKIIPSVDVVISDDRPVLVGDIVTFTKNFAISGFTISNGDTATVTGFQLSHTALGEEFTNAPKVRMYDGTEVILPMNQNGGGSYPTFFSFDSSDKSLKLVNNQQNNVVFVDPATGLPMVEGTYPMVLRPFQEQNRRPAQFQEFSQDGTRILKMKELADKLVVYRDSGFFFLTAANSTIQPFSVDPRYTGGRNADFRHTVIQVSGNQHIFVGNTGVYQINRSSTEPKPIPVFELGPPFWQIVPPELSEFIYSVDNPVTREIFINCPLGYKKNSSGQFVDDFNEPLTEGSQPVLDWGVIAYDYINQTLSQIDASFTACATIRKPKFNRLGPEQMWFIMGVHQSDDASSICVGTQYREDPKYGGVLVRYGYGPPLYGETEAYRIYSRVGYGYTSRIRSGLIDFGDSFSDKEVRSYVLELSSKYDVAPVRVKISTTSAPQGTETTETMSVVNGVTQDFVTLNEMQDENMIPLYLRAPYIRDEITVLPQYAEDPDNYVQPGYVALKTKTNTDGADVVSNYMESAIRTVLDNPIKIVGRTFEASGVNTRATTQATGQG